MYDILVSESDFLTKPLTSGISFSTLPIFVSRTAVVAKSLMSGILFPTSPIFCPNCDYLCCIDLPESK